MQITQGAVVSFHYTLLSDTGALIDSSQKRTPLTYLHGYQPLSVTSLEEALAGHEAGEEVMVTLPEEQFGKYDPQKLQELPLEAFPPTITLVPGARYTTIASGKEISFGVVKVKPTTVVVDFNHALAGKKTVLSVKVEEVRQATPEECVERRPL